MHRFMPITLLRAADTPTMATVIVSRLRMSMRLYRPDNVWRVGLSYLGCLSFYDGAQAQA
jgi:hypothetical protein